MFCVKALFIFFFAVVDLNFVGSGFVADHRIVIFQYPYSAAHFTRASTLELTLRTRDAVFVMARGLCNLRAFPRLFGVERLLQ